MKLPELKELAKQMGLKGTSTLRKDKLIEVLQAARSGAAVPEGVSISVGNHAVSAGSRKTEATTNTTEGANTQAAQTAQSAPSEPDAQAAEASEPAEPRVPRRARRATTDENGEPLELAGLVDHNEHTVLSRRVRGKRRAAEREAMIEEVASEAAQDALGVLDALSGERDAHAEGRSDNRLGVQRRRRAMAVQRGHDRDRDRAERRSQDQESNTEEELDDILAALPAREGEAERSNSESTNRRGRNAYHNDERGRGDDRNERNNRNDRDERKDRRRGRNRNDDCDRDERNERNDRADRNDRMNRRGQRDDANDRNNRRNNRPERAERDERVDEVVPVAGIVDVLDSYAFIRTSGYLPGPNDVYVSMGQIKKYGLRKGDAVQGTIKAPHEGEHRNARQKFVPLQAIVSINGMSVEEAGRRPEFSKLTPLYPNERLVQETDAKHLTGRLIDIIAPIGKGQRGLIVSPPKAGKTITLQNIANSIAQNNPEVHLMVVLVDERPEEVTDMERTVQGEVISSTFDRPASDHTIVAELAIERAKRLVELGQDVVVLLDSMTRLARAYNIAAPASGRILSGGVDAQALYPPKKFFGAARNIENGGSLTIISSALVETGSKMDEVIFEEFKGTGNMELRLSRELADKRLFPAIDINASGTRREELITAPKELPLNYGLRRLLGGLEPEQAYQTLVPRLRKTATNRDFYASMVQNSANNN